MIRRIIQKKVHCERDSWVHHIFSAANRHIIIKLWTIQMFRLTQKKPWKGKRKFLRFHISQTSYLISSLDIHISAILKKTDLFFKVHTLTLFQQILQRDTSSCCRLFFTAGLYCYIPILQSSWGKLLKTTGVSLTKTDTQKD